MRWRRQRVTGGGGVVSGGRAVRVPIIGCLGANMGCFECFTGAINSQKVTKVTKTPLSKDFLARNIYIYSTV